jgi:hypothetical protein
MFSETEDKIRHVVNEGERGCNWQYINRSGTEFVEKTRNEDGAGENEASG